MEKFLILIFVLSLSCLSCSQNLDEQTQEDSTQTVEETRDYSSFHQEALSFVKTKKYNTDYYFLLDYSIAPGKKRFFIYDFNSNEFVDMGLVTHGACDVNGINPDKWEKAQFSNLPDSHCSSKGKYLVSSRDTSGWGVGYKYWLDGLESTNNKAKQRIIVLHSWEAVPDEEVYPKNIALSWGCPAVSNRFMNLLDQKIKASSNKKILLWIIE